VALLAVASKPLKGSDGLELSRMSGDHPERQKVVSSSFRRSFGVNGHIRRVVDGFAADGFLVIVPALSDRFQPGIEIGYSQEDVQRIELKGQSRTEDALKDIEAAREPCGQ
jgi:carboxymethylenebutenolidase